MSELPAGEVDLERQVDKEYGAGTARSRTPVSGTAAAEFAGRHGDGEINIAASWTDDEAPHVHVRSEVAGVEITVTLALDEARRLSAQLRSAATQAETGDRELTGDTKTGP